MASSASTSSDSAFTTQDKASDLPTLADVVSAGGDLPQLRTLATSDSKALSKALLELGFAKLGDRSVLRQLLRPQADGTPARPQTAPVRAPLSADLMATVVDRWLTPVERLKEQGNAAFRAAEYERACELYEEAVRSLPPGRLEPGDGAASPAGPRSHNDRWRLSEACGKAKLLLITTLWCNVAAGRLKLQQWDAAEAAASTVLRLDPRHAKALFRRAVARRHRGFLQQARCDLMNALHADRGMRAECERELAAIDPAYRAL